VKFDLSDLPHFLKIQGKTIARGIVKGIDQRESLDGGPQKSNAPSTVRKKGHDHPLIGGAHDSPQLSREANYNVTMSKPNEVQISIKPIRAAAGVYVERKGYKFFGITKLASKIVLANWDRYVRGKVRRMFD
jgi:hypothetical protein|tara:strand:- start:1230 stop:1625 length:396 start_codon:yes stop_codon:yes gene_type:complete